MQIASTQFVRKLLLSLIIIWIVLAIGRTLYNISKVFSEENVWFSMTTEEKRLAAYGDLELIYRKIDSISNKNDCILLTSTSDRSYFLLRYLLYPKRIYWINSADKAINTPPAGCKYVLIYNPSSKKEIVNALGRIHVSLKEIQSFPDTTSSGNYSVLYQQK